MIKINYITTIEETVLNRDYPELRVARIEVWTDNKNQKFPYEVGRIEVFNDPDLFDAIREALEHRGGREEVKKLRYFAKQFSDGVFEMLRPCAGNTNVAVWKRHRDAALDVSDSIED